MRVKKLSKRIGVTISQYRGNQVGAYYEADNTHFVVKQRSNGNLRRYWRVRYQIDGKRQEITFSPSDDIKADRAKLLDIRKQLSDGVNPKAERVKAETARKAEDRASLVTFEDVYRESLPLRLSKVKNEKNQKRLQVQADEWILPQVGKVPMSQFDVEHVLAVMNQKIPGGGTLWANSNPTAEKVLATMQFACNFAMAPSRRYTRFNPCVWKGCLEFELPAKGDVHTTKSHPAMPYQDVPGWVVKLNERDSLTSHAIHLLLLSGVRVTNLLETRWTDLDLESKEWEIAKTKNSNPWTVPLTKQMLAVLNRAKEWEENEFVFGSPGAKTGHLSENSLLKELRGHYGFSADYTDLHGLRSTFSTGMNQISEFSDSRIDQCLQHQMGDAIEAAYNRSQRLNRRREVIQFWNDYCWSEVK